MYKYNTEEEYQESLKSLQEKKFQRVLPMIAFSLPMAPHWKYYTLGTLTINEVLSIEDEHTLSKWERKQFKIFLKKRVPGINLGIYRQFNTDIDPENNFAIWVVSMHFMYFTPFLLSEILQMSNSLGLFFDHSIPRNWDGVEFPNMTVFLTWKKLSDRNSVRYWVNKHWSTE